MLNIVVHRQLFSSACKEDNFRREERKILAECVDYSVYDCFKCNISSLERCRHKEKSIKDKV